MSCAGTHNAVSYPAALSVRNSKFHFDAMGLGNVLVNDVKQQTTPLLSDSLDGSSNDHLGSNLYCDECGYKLPAIWVVQDAASATIIDESLLMGCETRRTKQYDATPYMVNSCCTR